jgi:DNA polymerase-3 subunit beta
MSFESVDEQWLKVKAGASDFKIACLPHTDFPAWPSALGSGEVEEVTIDGSMLLEMIEKTIYSAGESDTRYTLNGLLFHAKPENRSFTVVGTDGHRLALIMRQMESEVKEDKKLIVRGRQYLN